MSANEFIKQMFLQVWRVFDCKIPFFNWTFGQFFLGTIGTALACTLIVKFVGSLLTFTPKD